jgi:hypothetical protein
VGVGISGNGPRAARLRRFTKLRARELPDVRRVPCFVGRQRSGLAQLRSGTRREPRRRRHGGRAAAEWMDGCMLRSGALGPARGCRPAAPAWSVARKKTVSLSSRSLIVGACTVDRRGLHVASCSRCCNGVPRRRGRFAPNAPAPNQSRLTRRIAARRALRCWHRSRPVPCAAGPVPWTRLVCRHARTAPCTVRSHAVRAMLAALSDRSNFAARVWPAPRQRRPTDQADRHEHGRTHAAFRTRGERRCA